MRYLQVFYALACTVWTMRLIQIVASARTSHPEATLSGAVICVLLLAVLPAVGGYVLVFKALPRASRLIWR